MTVTREPLSPSYLYELDSGEWWPHLAETSIPVARRRSRAESTVAWVLDRKWALASVVVAGLAAGFALLFGLGAGLAWAFFQVF